MTSIMTIAIDCRALRGGPQPSSTTPVSYQLFSGAVPVADTDAKYVVDVASAAQANELGHLVVGLCHAVHTAVPYVLNADRLVAIVGRLLQDHASNVDYAVNVTAIQDLTYIFDDAGKAIKTPGFGGAASRRVENAFTMAILDELKSHDPSTRDIAAFNAKAKAFLTAAMKAADDEIV